MGLRFRSSYIIVPALALTLVKILSFIAPARIPTVYLRSRVTALWWTSTSQNYASSAVATKQRLAMALTLHSKMKAGAVGR